MPKKTKFRPAKAKMRLSDLASLQPFSPPAKVLLEAAPAAAVDPSIAEVIQIVDDVQLEVTAEMDDEAAERFAHEINVEVMLDNAFAQFENPSDDFDIDLSEMDSHSTSKTIAPPSPEDFDPERTGEYTIPPALLWEFLESPYAEKYFRAQKKFEETKKLADRPDIEALIKDYQIRKGRIRK